jgi:glycosyltransferase involved in cell wall biosynthesis
MYRLLLFKRQVEDVFIFPFIILGRLIAVFKPLKKEFDIFLFFPFYHIGGAEKVHYEVAKVAGKKKAIIFFTKKSHNTLFLNQFQQSGCVIIDISKWTDNKFFYFNNLILRGILSAYINKQKKNTTVFNGQCNFGYKISPWIKPAVPQYELIHSFNTFSYIRIPFLPFITKTVMISKVRIEQHINFYKEKDIPKEYANRIVYIANAIALTSATAQKNTDTFTVLFVGRNSPEKRLHLFLKTAQQLQHKKENIKFEILGDVSESIDAANYPYVKFHGNQNDTGIINRIYSKAHALLLTSSTEGFPMVVIEAMNNGCAIIATPVGDIPLHIKNNENGFLFTAVTDEITIVNEAVDYILQLKNNTALCNSISKNNSNYALANFGITKFNEAYSKLLEGN